MNQMTIASVIIGIGMIAAAFIATGNIPGGGDGVKTFNIVMENNRYNPSEIVATVGDRVVINFENRDPVSHGVSLPQFNATVPNGHVPAGGTARMEFIADRAISTDAAVCGGPNPSDKTDDHGEELIVRVLEA
tara:strand:+ start:3310 stop:3708 length:399 start_codon:yes stop_codon:yes gene_type:complete